MRNKQEFQDLVFARAEEIKARDRRNKMIRLSVMPIAAAFVILTAVGIHGALSVPSGTATQYDAAADHAAENYDGSAGRADLYTYAEDNDALRNAPANAQTDEYTAKAAEPTEGDHAYSYEDASEDALTSETAEAVILTQSKITVKGSDKVNALYDALTDGEETEPSNTPCLGTVKFSDSELEYRLYCDRCEIYSEGAFVEARRYTVDGRIILKEYIDIE